MLMAYKLQCWFDNNIYKINIFKIARKGERKQRYSLSMNCQYKIVEIRIIGVKKVKNIM